MFIILQKLSVMGVAEFHSQKIYKSVILQVYIMTTIYVKKEVWKRLNALRQPGESLGEIIETLLDYYEATLPLEEDSLSDKEFSQLVASLHIPQEEFEKYLEKAKASFQRRQNDD